MDTPHRIDTTSEAVDHGAGARQLMRRRPVVTLALAGGVIVVMIVLVAVFLVARRDVTQVLVPPPDTPEAELLAELTLTTIDAEAGELGVRLVPVAQQEGRTEGGLVIAGFQLLVNDIGGQTTYSFPAGEPVRAIDFAVALGQGSVYRYPFDTYDAGIVVLAAEGAAPSTGEPLSVETSATSSIPDFELSATTEDCFDSECLSVEVSRPFSTIGYVLWFIVLIWGLALAGLGILYTTVRRGSEIPTWAPAYLVGVLFALSPLRASLPGSPPAGSFVDFVAFYWVVAMIGITLVALVGIWAVGSHRRAGD